MELEKKVRGNSSESKIKIYTDFIKGIYFAIFEVGKITIDTVKSDLREELSKRVAKGKSQENIVETWETFNSKVFRYRPRFVGSLAAYFALSGLTLEQVKENGYE